MEASRVGTPSPHPFDDPGELAAHHERLRQLELELDAEMTDEERAEADAMYVQLVERAKHWPE